MSPNRSNYRSSAALGFVLIGIMIFIAGLLIRAFWRTLMSIETRLAISLLTGAWTVIAATITIVLGRYLERKREIAAHFREKKTQIYDEFLEKLFKVFSDSESEDLVPFLREWQRKLVVWGGAPVMVAYIRWVRHLKDGNPDAQSVFLMEDFFRAMRSDLGLSNNGLQKGIFANFIIRNPEVLLEMAKENPGVTLAAVVEREKELGLNEDG